MNELTLTQAVEALAAALYVAGIRSGEKDGLPRTVAAGVYANLYRFQHVGLYRWVGGQIPEGLGKGESPSTPAPAAPEEK